MILSIDNIMREIAANRELDELNHSLNPFPMGVITPEELDRMEEEREDMLRLLSFNEIENEQLQ